MLLRASVTVAESWQVPRRLMSTNRLVRSTRVIRALRPPAPMTRSASQCPPAAPSSPLGAGADRLVAPRYRALAPGLGLLRPVGSGGVRRVRPVRRALSTRNWARALPAPWTHPGLGGSAREQGRMLSSSGFSNRRRAAICPGAGPDPPGGSTTRSRRAGLASSPADLGAGQGRPGRGLRRRGAVDPAPRPPRGGSRPARWAGTGRTWRAMRAAQVPLRQARG